MSPDFATTSRDYAHRPQYAPRLFLELLHRGVGRPGQRVLDVGAGTGLLSIGLWRRGCWVVAVDPGALLLAAARRAEPNLPTVVAKAECLPFADESFDVVTAAQAWHWFDRARAPREVRRVLRRGGAVAVVYQLHVPSVGSIAAASEQLILGFNSGWKHANSTGISGQALRDLQAAGFVDIESFSFDAPTALDREHWHGYVRTLSAVAGSMSETRLREFDQAHRAMLASGDRQVRVLFRHFAAVARVPAA